MAQIPRSASLPGMPAIAIATGQADYAFQPAALPGQVLAHLAGLLPAIREADEADAPLSAALAAIVILLRDRSGHDFSEYKSATIRRRIERRIGARQQKDAQRYLRILRTSPEEADLLCNELLVGVTRFFRDPDAFATLGRTALRHLFRARPTDSVMRVWVPACATGEEAYSLAILLRECAERQKKRFTFRLCGTDLDKRSIATARAGFYPESIAAEVSARRLGRFFRREKGGYRVKQEIRNMVIFGLQDACVDSPFTKLDLISCRNLLIYLNPSLQHRLLLIFHSALKSDGMLFLGGSESAGELRDEFTALEKRNKIYRRAAGSLAAVATPRGKRDARAVKSPIRT